MASLEKTRLDVERELALRAERIERAVTRLRRDVSTPLPILTQYVKKHPLETVIAVVALGAVVGLLFTRRGGRSKKSAGVDGVKKAYADAIAASIRSAEESGASRDEAVQRAIQSNPPIVVPSSNSDRPGYLEQMGGRLVQALTPIVFDYASTWISRLVEGRRTTS